MSEPAIMGSAKMKWLLLLQDRYDSMFPEMGGNAEKNAREWNKFMDEEKMDMDRLISYYVVKHFIPEGSDSLSQEEAFDYCKEKKCCSDAEDERLMEAEASEIGRQSTLIRESIFSRPRATVRSMSGRIEILDD